MMLHWKGVMNSKHAEVSSSFTFRRRMRVHHCKGRRGMVRCVANDQDTYVAPSNRLAGTELGALERFSVVIPDTQLSKGFDKDVQPKAATASRRILAGIMANPTNTSFGKFKFAIEQARFYQPPGGEKSSQALKVDKALVNAAALMLESVSGKVSVEVDPRLAYDTEKLVERSDHLMSMFAEIGVSKDSVLLQMPATWEAIQASKRLELSGYATHLICVYSYVQAVAAIQAGISVIQVNVGRIDDWYDKHPGVIRDPEGPREDRAMAMAGYGAPPINPGIPLVKKIYDHIHQKGSKTKLIASGMRSKDEVLALSGCDYLVVGPQVLNALKSTSTLDGYNDGLHASTQDFESLEPELSPEKASESPVENIDTSQSNFVNYLGMMGKELLEGTVQRLVEDAERLEPILLNTVSGQE